MRFWFAAMTAATFSFGAAAAPSYLRCSGQNNSGAKLEHVIVLDADDTTVDGTKYELGRSETEYALTGPKDTVAAMFGAFTLFDIDRVTGNYAISHGTSQTESGHCAKVQRQF
jgi:hypothetical protein